MSVMARICAAWLVALITAPWSAPFPVCDASTFFDRAAQPASSARVPLEPAASRDDATAHAVPVMRTAPRVQIMVALEHPSLGLTLAVSARAVRLFAPITLANSPLVTPLRI